MQPQSTDFQAIEEDIWAWINGFVTANHEFYQNKFAPCPFARKAVVTETVDVMAWRSGDVRGFIKEKSSEIQSTLKLTTRVMAFPPRTQFQWGISDYVESVNAELISGNVFLNTGVAKTTTSRYTGSMGAPYFIVVANRLNAVLAGAEALKRSSYYQNWPSEQYELVVLRRERMAKLYGLDQ